MTQEDLNAVAVAMLNRVDATDQAAVTAHNEIAEALTQGNPDRAAELAKAYPETRDWLSYKLGTKTPKPFASRAQKERCERLVTEGTMTRAAYDACLAVTDVDALPERLHPKKEKPAAYAPAGEGMQDGGEGLEAGRNPD